MRDIVLKRVYRHFKGDCYLVEDVARHSETGEEYVVYRKLYGDGSLWIRPKSMFLDRWTGSNTPTVHSNTASSCWTFRAKRDMRTEP